MHSKTQKQGELQHTEMRLKRTLKKEIFIFVKNIVLPKYWFVVSNF